MRILQLVSSLNPTSGGVAESVLRLSESLNAVGISVDVCCTDGSAHNFAQGSLLPITSLGPALGNYGFTIRLEHWLHAHAHEYDAVIVNGLWQYIGFATWRTLAVGKTPYFVFTHGMLDPWFKHTYPLKHLKKWLYWPWAEYRVLRDARRVIFTCEEERLLARESFGLYKVKEAVTCYGTSSPPTNADALRERFYAAYPNLRGCRLLLFLSRIHEKKGCDLLLDAFAQIAAMDPRLHLIIAGPDQQGWVPKLQAQATCLSIAERITWPGMMQGDVKWGAFYAAEVFCLPSHQENFGIVVAEALACGKPVLISNKVNIWREIEEDEAGFVDSDTLAGTVRNLQRWLGLSPTDYQAMAARATITFNKRFHIKHATQRLFEIIRDAI